MSEPIKSHTTSGINFGGVQTKFIKLARIYFFGLEEISYQSYENSLSNDVQNVANHQTAIS